MVDVCIYNACVHANDHFTMAWMGFVHRRIASSFPYTIWRIWWWCTWYIVRVAFFFLSRCVCLYVYAAPKVDSDYTHQPNNILITSQRFLHVLQTDKHKLKHLFIYHNGNGLTHSVHCKDVIVSLYLGFRQLYLLSSGPSGFEPCTRARFRSAEWHLFSVNVYGY